MDELKERAMLEYEAGAPRDTDGELFISFDGLCAFLEKAKAERVAAVKNRDTAPDWNELNMQGFDKND